MCYMQRIGLRELRQHASRYVDLVAKGETLEIAVRGRPVARMVPIVEDSWEDMITRGEIIPAPSGADLLDEPPGDYGIDVSAELLRMRTEDDR
jgi:prevent-host-death family protein